MTEVDPGSRCSPTAGGWVMYLVECRDGSLYSGCTTDLSRRLAQHNAGRGGAYTRSRRPVAVRYQRACGSESEAKRLEAFIKSWSRPQKLALCRDGHDPRLDFPARVP
ncbi:MAG: GIY-YIG nuclease family protein [Nitrospiria bacterium]